MGSARVREGVGVTRVGIWLAWVGLGLAQGQVYGLGVNL